MLTLVSLSRLCYNLSVTRSERRFFASAPSRTPSPTITRRFTSATQPSRRSTASTRRDAGYVAPRIAPRNPPDRCAIKDGTARSWTNIWSNLSSASRRFDYPFVTPPVGKPPRQGPGGISPEIDRGRGKGRITPCANTSFCRKKSTPRFFEPCVFREIVRAPTIIAPPVLTSPDDKSNETFRWRDVQVIANKARIYYSRCCSWMKVRCVGVAIARQKSSPNALLECILPKSPFHFDDNDFAFDYPCCALSRARWCLNNDSILEIRVFGEQNEVYYFIYIQIFLSLKKGAG